MITSFYGPFIIALACCLLVVPRHLVAEEQPSHERRTATKKFDVNYSVEYSTYGDQRRPLLADVYVPVGDGRFPTILMIHGGAWFSGNKVHVTQHARSAVAHGFAVVAINYRLAPAHPYPAQLDDCRTALEWIVANADTYGFDEQKIAAYGYSAGAHLACLLGLTQNETHAAAKNGRTPLIRAVVAGGTPCEFSWIPPESQRLAFWLGGSPKDLPQVYRMASPITHVDAKDPPVFLYHGKTDRIVPSSSAAKMKQELDENGVHSALDLLESSNHMTTFLDAKVRRRALAFLDAQFSARQSSESLASESLASESLASESLASESLASESLASESEE